MEPFLLGAAGIVLNPLIRATMKAAGTCLEKDSLASFAAESFADVFGDLAGSAAESTLESLRRDGNFHLESALAEALAKALEFAKEQLPVAHAYPLTTWRNRLLDTSPGAREALFVATDPTDPTQLTAELSPEQWWDQMLPSLLRWSNGEAIPAETADFLRPRLYGYLRKAYLHLLRDPQHGKAWIAYQQRHLETIAVSVRADHRGLALDIGATKDAVLAELERQTERVLVAVAGVGSQVAALREEVIARLPDPARLHNVPDATAHFTGREHHLETLHAQLQQSTDSTVVAALHGLGGVGKTQIALEYARRHSADYGLLWFVHAESTSTIYTDLAVLAQAARLPEAEQTDQNVMVQAVRRYLHDASRSAPDGRPWLLIFDNAETPAALEPFLVRGEAHGRVVITSRNADWSRLTRAPLIEVDKWLRAESVAFLLERTEEVDRAAAEAVANELEDLPLALEQAAAFVQARRSTLAAYARLLSTRKDELLKLYPPSPDYPHPVATTWHLAFERLQTESPAALAALERAAWFAPESIPFLLLPEPFAPSGDELARGEAVEALVTRYSLAKLGENEHVGQTLTVHRLVQAVVRKRLRDAGRDKAVLEEALEAAGEEFEFEQHDLETWDSSGALEPHLRAATEAAEKADVALTDCSRVLNNLGQYIHTLARYSDAISIHRRALALAERSCGETHHQVAICANNLGLNLLETGDLAAARALVERALKIDEQIFGPDHPRVATSANNLGQVFKALGEFGMARDYIERALKIDEAMYGSDHPTVAIRLSALGGICHALCDLEAARSYTERALRLGEEAFGPNDPTVATRANNLGSILKDLGDPHAAREYTERALRIDEAAYGLDHPTVIRDINNPRDDLHRSGRPTLGKGLSAKSTSPWGDAVRLQSHQSGLDSQQFSQGP